MSLQFDLGLVELLVCYRLSNFKSQLAMSPDERLGGVTAFGVGERRRWTRVSWLHCLLSSSSSLLSEPVRLSHSHDRRSSELQRSRLSIAAVGAAAQQGAT
jgi:hypothetical protein